MNVETGGQPNRGTSRAAQRTPSVSRTLCLECGIDLFWSSFDLQWSHMGWTVNGKQQPKPHRPLLNQEAEI